MPVKKLYLDTETFSTVPIKHGTFRYFEGAELLVVTYAFDGGPVWAIDYDHDGTVPKELDAALRDPAVLKIAHNVSFDRQAIKLAGYDIPIEQWYDTSIQARAHALPGSLATLCEVFGLAEDLAKSKDGKALIRLFCVPRPKNAKTHRATSTTHPVEWRKFLDYAKSDIHSMRALHYKMPQWNYKGAELDLWRLDQKINERGICCDVDLARAALRATDAEQLNLSKAINASTNGEVESARQRDAMLAHILKDYGVALPDLTKGTLERRLEDPDIPDPVKELLRIRLSAATSSTAKYKALINSVSIDGRLRGTLQFAGAGRTARWSGRIFQPQNLFRPKLKQKVIDAGIDALKAGAEDIVVSDIMGLASSALRGVFIAPRGKRLVVSDLSNIEGRMGAWLADETWKLNAFTAFDKKEGPDLYNLAYSKSFGVPPESVTKDQRQIGKVQELALLYEGGAGAFANFAVVYGIDLEALADKAWDTIPNEILEEAESFRDWREEKGFSIRGMSKHVFVVCESLKRLWRYAHPNITKLWKHLKEAATTAIQHPGVTTTAGRLKFRRDGAWLRMALPSGRCLCYLQPQVEDDGSITYMGVSQYTRKWERIHTHGGKLLENASQAGSRDVMGRNMPDIEADGFEIVLTVHDEVITETPDDDEFTAQRLSALLAQNKPWSEGLPLAAAGYHAYRYKKD